MSYNKDKDVILKEIEVCGGEYKVALCQYDGGEKKIAILKRLIFEKDGKAIETYTSKIGRIKLVDFEEMNKALQEILNEING